MLTMPAPPYLTISTNFGCSQSSPLYWLLSLHSSFQRVAEGWDTKDTKKAAHRTSQWKYFQLRASHFKHIQLQGESKFSVMIGWVLKKYDSS